MPFNEIKLPISYEEIFWGQYLNIRCPACKFYACVDCAELNIICNSIHFGQCVHYGNNH